MASSGNLDSFVAELNLDTKPAAKRLDVFPQSIIGTGQRSAIATLVERKSRLTVLVPIRGGRTAQIVGDALIQAFTILPKALRGTLTWDQGNEMFHNERIERGDGSAYLLRRSAFPVAARDE